jgi:hypothetical protein
MTERDFWREMQAGLCSATKPGELLLLRIETATAVGVPDVFFATPGRCGWIELKVGPALNLRSSQQAMLGRLVQLGVPALVALRGDMGMSIHTIHTDYSQTYSYYCHSVFKTPIDWAAVLEVLEGGP